MLEIYHTKHIRISSLDGKVYIDFDDYEVFDLIGDFLEEKHNVEQDYHEELEDGKSFRMYLKGEESIKDIFNIVKSISEEEIEKTYQLNNKE